MRFYMEWSEALAVFTKAVKVFDIDAEWDEDPATLQVLDYLGIKDSVDVDQLPGWGNSHMTGFSQYRERVGEEIRSILHTRQQQHHGARAEYLHKLTFTHWIKIGEKGDKPPRGYRPTQNLRRKVFACLAKVHKAKYQIDRGAYLSFESYGRGGERVQGQCCALGAISICQKKPTKEEVLGEDGDHGGRSHDDVFALTRKHLKCHPIEIDSIEAGFEAWSFGCGQMRHATQTMATGHLDQEAYSIGHDIYRKYVLGVRVNEGKPNPRRKTKTKPKAKQ